MCFGHDLLIGQFAGGGTTESSDSTAGKFDELLQDATGKPIAINGFGK
jgi:succinate dehydrogenase flavin-adding protein (antitoxin of CptAB toxin-antitoxin module)